MRKVLLLITLIAATLSGFAGTRSINRTPVHPSIWYKPDTAMHNPYLTDSVPVPDSYTMMMVYHSLMPDSMLQLWSFTTDSDSCIISNRRQTSIPLIYTMYHTPPVDTTRTRSAHLHIGSEPDTVNRMLMYEAAYFPITLTRPQALMFQTYLALRYGITLSRSNYVSTQGTVIWDARLYRDFYHHIQGIGSDPFYNYYATRSVSLEDSLLRISSNDTLPPFSYALLGDDNAPLDWMPYEGNRAMLQRRWMLHSTGDTPALSLSLSNYASLNNADTLLLAILTEEDELVAAISPENTDSITTYTLPSLATDIYFSFMSRFEHVAPKRSKNSDHSSGGNVTDNEYDESISLTPAVTHGSFVLDMDLSSERTLVISIHDAAGKLAQRHKIEATTTCQFSGFISGQGTYLVTVSDVHNTVLFNQQIIVY